MQSRRSPSRKTRSNPSKHRFTIANFFLLLINSFLDRSFRETSDIGAIYLADKEHLYLGDALGNDVIRERRELLLQLMEQLHDSDVRAMALPHRGPPSSWQGLPVGARSLVTQVSMIRPRNKCAHSRLVDRRSGGEVSIERGKFVEVK